MRAITYCARGCVRTRDDTTYPATTNDGNSLCDNCVDHLRRDIREIPDRYALLPHFIEHGTVQRDPDSKASARTEAQAPMRLDIIDHLDTRLGRHWQGLIPTTDRRGVVGTLHVHAQRIRDEKPLTTLDGTPTVNGEAALISRHLLWLIQQDWAVVTLTELDQLNRQLADAIGDYRPRPIGVCTVDNGDGPCGGPLLPSRLGGVHCPRCHAVWDIDELRRLGLILAGETA